MIVRNGRHQIEAIGSLLLSFCLLWETQNPMRALQNDGQTFLRDIHRRENSRNSHLSPIMSWENCIDRIKWRSKAQKQNKMISIDQLITHWLVGWLRLYHACIRTFHFRGADLIDRSLARQRSQSQANKWLPLLCLGLQMSLLQ